MKPFSTNFLLGVLLLFATIGRSQDTADAGISLENPPADTNAVKMLVQQAENYFFSNPDSCLLLSDQVIAQAKKINDSRSELRGLIMAGESLRMKGEYSQALERQFDALEITKKIGDKIGQGGTMSLIGWIYVELYEYRRGLNEMMAAEEIYKLNPEPASIVFNLSNIGLAYAEMGLVDSALFFQQQAWKGFDKKEFDNPSNENLKVLVLSRFATVLSKLGKHDEALKYFHQALQLATRISQKINLGTIGIWIGESYLTTNQLDSSLHYAHLSLEAARKVSQKLQILDASRLLVKIYRIKHVPDSVIHYQDIAIAMNDSLYGPSKLKQVQLLALREQERQQYLLQQQERSKNRTRTFALLAILGSIIVIAIILFRNNYRKQKVNAVLRDQKNEIQETLTKLRSTQRQLVQSEKMASLGELTAGIAHEIQNPLNFVNNFSELSNELLDEMNTEIEQGNSENVKAIVSNVKQNLEKINHHGKRADSIVKGMLQHSRSSAGTKEMTDINALAAEYLRLSHHGLRSKDKSFNATLETDFDNSIGKIPIIPQDIGRVLQNLYNNAFYAVIEKKKQNPNGYEPTVTVITTKANSKVEIRVKDNGNGIPQKVYDKIFQPFFTTKPTGEGTGLGLSLAYDVVKAHGGELKVETKENEGSEFIIELPAH